MTDRSSFGPELRGAREARGLTLEEIAEVTKVSASLYRGLENNDLSRWPSGLFRRSFVRNYAEAVGLDPDETCRRFVRFFPEDGDAVPEMHAVPLPPAPTQQRTQSEPPRLLLASAPSRPRPEGSILRRLGAALVDVCLAAGPGAVAGLLAGPGWFWVAAFSAGALGHAVALAALGRTLGAAWLLQERRPEESFVSPDRRMAGEGGRGPRTEGPVLVSSRRTAPRPAAARQAGRRRR